MSGGATVLKLAGVLVILFGAGIVLGVGYEWLQGAIIPGAFFVTAAGNSAPSDGEALSSDVAAPAAIQSPSSSSATISNATPVESPTPALQSDSNVVVLNQIKPSPIPSPSGGNELMLPQVQPNQSPADRLPVIGSQGETIWVPQAIEGCWEGTGDSRLQYLGGCPNLMSGRTSPIKLRWCFQRMGNQPLILTMAKGQYGGRVSQRWVVMSARGQTIALRETISYMTMMFLHVVDVGDWSCRITSSDELICQEHELAKCGPAKWAQAPWFRGSGSVTAKRAGERHPGRHMASGHR